MDLLDWQVDKHTSDLWSKIFTSQLLNVLIDVLSNLRFIVGVEGIDKWEDLGHAGLVVGEDVRWEVLVNWAWGNLGKWNALGWHHDWLLWLSDLLVHLGWHLSLWELLVSLLITTLVVELSGTSLLHVSTLSLGVVVSLVLLLSLDGDH